MTAHLSEIRGVASGKILFDEEDLPRLLPHSWSIGSHGYAQGCGGGIKIITMHKHLMGPPPPGMLIDHVNRDRLDNRRVNLRFLTFAESNLNRGPAKCVHLSRHGNFEAKLRRKGVRISLGTFKTEAEAIAVVEAWRLANDPF
jgi:hypothetical protein